MARAEFTFDRFATTAVYGAAFLVACLSPAQSDTYWQLRAGRYIWHTGTIPRVDHWSDTAAGRPWPDHEWLWQAVAYPLHQLGGMPLLTAVTAVCALAALVLARRLAPPWGRTGIVAVLAALVSVSPEWSLRPQVTSTLLFAVTLTLVSRERYLLIPPLFLLWANLHAGVASGGVMLAASSGLAAVMHVRGRTRETRRRLLLVTGTTAASALATLVNPLGWGLWRYVLSANRNPAHAGNADWQTAFHLGPVQALFWLWLAAFTTSVIARRRRFGSWPQRLLLVVGAASALLAMAGVRNITFFVLSAMPAVIIALAPPRPSGDRVPHSRMVLAAGAAVAALLVGLTWWAPPTRLNWQPMSRQVVAAVQHCPRPLYNSYDAGGYLLWFAPGARVFIDSRADPYRAGLVLRAERLEATGDYRSVFARYGIRCAVVPSRSATAAALTAHGWAVDVDDRRWKVLSKSG